MSKDRARPWHNPTPLLGFTPIWAGQFDTFNDWVNHATRALTGETGNFGEVLKAVCIDAKGRRCNIGGDFMRARDEDAFPVRYFFTGKVDNRTRQRRKGPLSAREQQVMDLVDKGHSTKAIALALGVSPRTVDTHRYHASMKLRAAATSHPDEVAA